MSLKQQRIHRRNNMHFRKELNGMLPAAIEKFEKLLENVPDARVVRGYNVDEGKDSFFSWGCACQMLTPDMKKLQTEAEKLGITWLGKGNMVYKKERTIADFKTFRVDSRLKLRTEKEMDINLKEAK